MRNHAGVTRRQLRTSNYSAEARAALGAAVEAARIAAGYKYRTDFCRAHNIKNLRGLELLERGETGVGQAFLFEIADALPGWTRATPQHVLEGQPPPFPVAEASADSTEESTVEDLPEDERQRFLMARDFMRTQGRELTVRMWRIMQDEYERLEEVERSREPGHTR